MKSLVQVLNEQLNPGKYYLTMQGARFGSGNVEEYDTKEEAQAAKDKLMQDPQHKDNVRHGYGVSFFTVKGPYTKAQMDKLGYS